MSDRPIPEVDHQQRQHQLMERHSATKVAFAQYNTTIVRLLAKIVYLSEPQQQLFRQELISSGAHFLDVAGDGENEIANTVAMLLGKQSLTIDQFRDELIAQQRQYFAQLQLEIQRYLADSILQAQEAVMQATTTPTSKRKRAPSAPTLGLNPMADLHTLILSILQQRIAQELTMILNTSRSTPNISRRKVPPTMMIIHATVGGLESSLGHLTNPASRVSSHYVISRRGVIYQLADPATAITWHAGRCLVHGVFADVNALSIGYELENKNTGTDPYPAEQIAALTEIVRHDMQRFSILARAIFRHLDVAYPPKRKSDPAGFPWETWKESLESLSPHPLITSQSARVNTAVLHVRLAPGLTFQIVEKLNRDTHITILEQQTDGSGMPWGRIGKDTWVSLTYVTLA